MSVIGFRKKQGVNDTCHADLTGESERNTYVKIAETFGNGDELKGFALLHAITMRLVHARRKHPLFAEGAQQAIGVIGAEYEELVQAVEHETPERQVDEALDVAVTAIRMVNGEHKIAPGAKGIYL